MDSTDKISFFVNLFWNYIRLGQWELAYVTIKSIKEISWKHYENLLLAVILSPDKHSSGSKLLLSPFHLSWLAANELTNDFNFQLRLPPQIKRELEFKMLLCEFETEFPKDVLQELSVYHKQLVQVEIGLIIVDSVDMFSSACVDLIGELVIVNPKYAMKLTEMLTGKGKVYEVNNFSLSQLFCNRISAMITDLIYQDLSSPKSNECFQLLTVAKKHLSYTDTTLIAHLKNLTQRLMVDSPDLLQKFYNSLIDINDSELLFIVDAAEQEFILQDIRFEHAGKAVEVVTNLMEENSEKSWMKIFLLCYHYKKHVLQCVVDGILYLLNSKKFTQVSSILMKWKPLAPLVLLIAWVDCSNFADATLVLECLVGNAEDVEGYFGPICRKLVHQITLVKWCIDKTREILGEDYDNSLLLNKLFKQLGSNSVLSVLNETNLLKLLKNEEIINLLEQQHSIDFSSTFVNATKPSGDVETFLCYAVLKKFFNLILSTLKGSLTEQDGIIVPFTKELVRTYLSEIKYDLKKIGSMPLRIEVLQNIFSLLFLRSSDLKQFQKEDIDLDNIEEMSMTSMMSRSLNRSVSMSLESLSTISDDLMDSRNAFPDNITNAETAKRALFSAERTNQNQLKSSDVMDVILQDINGSSTSDTVKARTQSEDTIHNINIIPPQFLVNDAIVKETLIVLSECLREITIPDNSETNANSLLNTGSVQQQYLSTLQRFIQEAQWRLELISGFEMTSIQSNKIIGRKEHHLISNMLCSAESLVYLTLSKGDLIQAKQVVKMFSLYDNECSKEVDLTEKLAVTSEKLLSISKPAQPVKPHSALSFVKSAASAGKISSEIGQVVEAVFHHEFLKANQESFPLIQSNICVDFMFTLPLPLNICKTLIDLAIRKCEKGSGKVEHNVYGKIFEKLKDIKSLLQLTTTRTFKVFQLFGWSNPVDFLSLTSLLSTKLLHDTLEFEESKFIQGQTAFNNLSSHITSIIEEHKTLEEERREEKNEEQSTSLKELVSNLLAVFSTETIAQLNHISLGYDYLKSLFRYVNTLSSMQLYYKMRQTNDSSDKTQRLYANQKAVNPFVIFEDSISDTFGKLLFQYRMNPKKLESFASQTGINLLKVISQNCGISIPSNICNTNSPDMLLFTTPVILNCLDGESFSEVEIGRSPNLTVEELLTSALDMVSENEQPSQLTDSEVYQMLKVSTKELQKIDFNELKTCAEKLSFFVNLFNLMFLHGLLLVTSRKMEHDFVLTSQEMLSVLSTSIGRLVFHHMIGYYVGSVGIISAFDIYYYIFLNGKETDFFTLTETCGWRSWKLLLSKYAPSDCNPLCIFLLSHGTVDSPIIQVTYPSKVESMMKSYSREYLDDRVGIDMEKKEIFIPEMVLLHKKRFQPRNNKQSISDNNKNTLLTALTSIASSPLKEKLNLLTNPDDFTITIEKHNWNLRCSRPSSEHVVVKREFDTLVFSDLSPSILSYLTDRNPLIATFISLNVTRNKLVKNITSVFENNLLHLSTDKENELTIFESIQTGLHELTKETASYSALKNFVVESSSKIINIIQHLTSLERTQDKDLLKSLYICVQNILIRQFLVTLSDDDFKYILPNFIQSCLATNVCHILPLHLLELIMTLPKSMYNMLCLHSIMEKKENLLALSIADDVKQTKEEISFLKKDMKKLLLLINDLEMKCYYAVELAKLLDAKDSLDILKVCIEESDGVDEPTQQQQLLQISFQQIHWCNKVFLASQLYGRHDIFTSWQAVESSDPQCLIKFLLTYKEYQLLDEWFDVYDMSDNVKESYVKLKLQSLLQQDESDYIVIQLTIEKLPSNESICNICREVLQEDSTYSKQNLFIIQHLLKDCNSLLPLSERKSLVLNKLGILAIELIPIDYQVSYKPLQYYPLLIVEQLIMNMKMAIANKIVMLFNEEHHKTPQDITVSSLVKECDELVTRYAALALDLSILRPGQTTPGQSPRQSPSQSPSITRREFLRSPTSTSYLTSPWGPVVLRVDSPDRLEHLRKEEDSTCDIHTPPPPARNEFVPPLQAVDKKTWVKDDQVSSCMNCHDLFNMFNRRHHCRHCGRVICATCSQCYLYMQRYQRKERVCIECYNFLHKSSYNDQSLKSNSGSLSRSPFESLRGGGQKQGKRFDLPFADVDGQPEWILSPDKTKNKVVYEDFSFEQAPSASLCLALVDLYSNQNAAGGLLVTFCNNLSQYLQIRTKQGEIDVNMVAGMIEFILYHAKLKFLKNGNSDGVELCDTHLSRIEILKVLLEDNWRKIPTMQELTHPEYLRRLRDQLIEHERFSLAMEITSKCALDPTPVHFVLGLSKLKCGFLEKAREHFARCLTGNRGDSVKVFSPNSHYLETIIETIESFPMISFNQIEMPQDSSLHIKPLMEHYKSSYGKYCLDKKRYDEIMHYLKAYGSHVQFIKFFVRNNLIKKALLFIREKKCSHEMFISQLLQPCFKDGTFEILFDEIKKNDPPLKFWEAYLNESCVFLSKHSFYHCLYQLQLFIKDYFRAALTCVRFYLGTASAPATSYSELNRRLKYLDQANEHLNHLVKEQTSRSSFVSHVGSSFLGDDKTLSNQEISTSELKRHLSTVNLQIDVTKYLSGNEQASGFTKKIPTLFGNGKERAELAINIMMFINDEALSLGSRIIQEFKLPSHVIFGRTLKRIAESQKYSHVLTMLQKVDQNGMINSKEKDDILGEIIKVIVYNGQVKDGDQFIKQIKNDIIKINALILCGRLRDAYLEAVKNERITEIQRILDKARQLPSQKNMIGICEKWLRNHQENQERKQNALSSGKS